jgi:hypothetical protein
VIYKNDMMIESGASNKMNCSDIFYLIFAIIFMITFYGAIFPTIKISSGYGAAIGLSWLFY